ncbi:hypothetical protein ACFYXJ_19360 [Streptomyces sp. NPDC002667]|uniref:hypothetical protein n=1 Tax=Streptomyces sp. NPDC002667 TaxID=3364657 RepID=UPI0036AE908B
MSTERPDNDATDPVGGHARGPVESPAEDAVTDPPEKTVTDPDGNSMPEPTGDRAGAPDEDRAGAATDGPAESGSGPDEDQAEGPDKDPAQAATGGTAESGDGPEQAQEQTAGLDEVPDETATGGTAESGAGPEQAREQATGLDKVPDETASGGAAESGDGPDADQAEADRGAAVLVSGSGSGSGSGGESVPLVGGDLREHPEGSADLAGGARGRRRTPMAVASVVAAVLLVGGGGAYFAATASGGGRSSTPGADGSTPPPLALDGYVAGTAGIAPGEPNPYGTTYRASGPLPAGPGSAHVRWAEGGVTRTEVARLAKALGLAGTPRLTGDAWTVGSVKDGNEPNLRVTAEAPGTWTFSSSLPGSDNCVKGRMCPLAGSGSPADPGPAPVSVAAAEKAAAPVLKAVGQDDAKLDASQLMDQVRVVNADPVVGGLPTYGWTTGLRIGADGHVIGGSGQLKTPVEGDAYPVVGAKKTLDLMNGSAPATDGHRMGIGGCASPVPLKDRDEMPCEHPSPAKPQTATVEKATFGLAAQRANGRQALVPSWLFEVRSPGAQDTYTVTHPAVDPAFLASPESPSQPGADPSLPVPVPSGGTSSPAATRDVGVQGYTAHGRDLAVDFTGGVCASYTVSASESAAKVTVTVTAKPWKNKVCIMIAKIYERTVRLDAPLGDREVVGSDGKAIHQGRFGVPVTSGAASAGPR